MNLINRRSVIVWWFLTVILMISGQRDGRQEQTTPPQRRYPPARDQFRRPETDEFDEYNKNELIPGYTKYHRPRPQNFNDFSSSSFDRISRMGEEIKHRMQETFRSDYLKSMIEYYTKSNDGYSESGCCEGLDFNTFVPGFVLVAVSYALFFLLNATVTSGRRKRMVSMSEEEEKSKFCIFIVPVH